MSSIQTSSNGQLSGGNGSVLAKRDETIQGILSGAGMKKALAMALPKHVTADRIVRVALTAISKNPDLARCSQQSFFGSLLSAAQLGLEVNTPLGHAYLIPYKSVCTLIIGYQGMIDLAGRCGARVRGNVVRDGDFFEVEYGLEQKLIHRPATDEGREERQVTHVYAIGTPATGDPIFVVLSRAEVEKFRKRSASKDSGPWKTDWEAMALKTAVRRLFRWMPKSIELTQAIALDEAHERDSQRETYDATVVDAIGSLQLQAPEAQPEAQQESQAQPREPGQEG